MKKTIALALMMLISPWIQATDKSLSKNSLYQLSMTLTDQSGQSAGLDVFKGHPVLISMFYASCPYACPLLVKAVQKIENGLPQNEKANLRVLLVSFDPDRDTVEVLGQAVKKHRIDESRWKLARAPESQSRQLANLLRIKFKKNSDTDYDHSSVITVLNTEGEIVFSREGLDSVAADDVRAHIPK